MKRFQMETRGILKDSAEYIAVRNRIYDELRKKQSEDKK